MDSTMMYLHVKKIGNESVDPVKNLATLTCIIHTVLVGHRLTQTNGHQTYVERLELVSKELNHFGVIADLLRQIGGHSSRFVLFCSF